MEQEGTWIYKDCGEVIATGNTEQNVLSEAGKYFRAIGGQPVDPKVYRIGKNGKKEVPKKYVY